MRHVTGPGRAAQTDPQQPTTRTAPVYAADADDHEALLTGFLDTHHDWEKYRTFPIESAC
ncbi:hypothetical protein ACH4FX_41505 [Streptomyces sp. NPDC018019]|uniref:hypothetical protein n=1 Tax=Streptomyces sp. NPDC018019 TaxID=3365030 RepID=UPI0037B10551